MHQVVLLRGINIGSHNRIAMPELRDLFTKAGFGDVRTYVQSGNLLLCSDEAPAELAEKSRHRIRQHFGLDVGVVVRTRDELAEVVSGDPLKNAATDPKRYQVTFLSEPPDEGLVEDLGAFAAEPERCVTIGREIYTWHPNGIARSKLWQRLSSKRLGITATARNWTTVTMLLKLADE